jgi:hypothetical protein
MFGYAQELAARKRDEPGDDIASALLAAEVDGHKLTDREFNLFFMLLINAGGDYDSQPRCQRHAHAARQPRPTRGVARQPCAAADRRRGDAALRAAGVDVPTDGHA